MQQQVVYHILSFPDIGKFLGDFKVKGKYHKIIFVETELEAQNFSDEDRRNLLGTILLGMGYHVEAQELTATIQ